MMSYGSSHWRDWVLDENESRPIIRRAIELGINFFDTADMYSAGISEEVTGRSLLDFVRREEVVIASKVYFPTDEDDPNARGLSRKHIMHAIDNSLRRLGTDYIDLYQIHRWDYTTPVEETLEALHDPVKAGKARYIGASSMHAWQFAKALHLQEMNGWVRFISMQNLYNLLYREEEREMLPMCLDQGVGVIPWSPLARGFLAGNRSRHDWGDSTRAKSDTMAQEQYYGDRDFDIVDRVVQLAQQRGVSAAQISLAWLTHQEPVSAPIIGATRMAHLEEAVEASKLSLNQDELAFLEELYRPRAVMGYR
jgi:aryl-alcohol dehydrogenase (NADP+)